ncbi:MAG: hypothetical protein COA78_38100 [Blastopirellula sp.]|nr:MAG: hypothetical protein COA78_38100 [Blastopirellula sp.]
MTKQQQYDVMIFGSGFGGCLTAAILAKRGMSVLMIDKLAHPRFAIGESSTPAADLILHELATKYDLPDLMPLTKFGTWRQEYPDVRCGCKRGFSYFWHGHKQGFQANAMHDHELLVNANASREVADTQWYRADVDQLFATVAQQQGATLLEEARVLSIEHPQTHQWHVTIEHEETEKVYRSRFVIDASGPSGVLLNALKIESQTDQLQTHSSAVYGHFNDVPPLKNWLNAQQAIVSDYPFPVDDSAVHHLFHDGWAWQLRFEDGLTSLGFVLGNSELKTDTTPRETWNSILSDHPVMRELLDSATEAEYPGQLSQTGRLQRLRSQAAGEDWAALPSAVGFIDPLHSTGIAHTLSGVERVCHALLDFTEADRTVELNKYSQQVNQEFRLIDLLVAGCYLGLKDFRLFTAWSMIYFAAATTYEQNRTSKSTSLFCADDQRFILIITTLYQQLEQLCSNDLNPSDQAISQFVDQVKVTISPYNHVGLFEPVVNNMYHYTATAK